MEGIYFVSFEMLLGNEVGSRFGSRVKLFIMMWVGVGSRKIKVLGGKYRKKRYKIVNYRIFLVKDREEFRVEIRDFLRELGVFYLGVL